jgi:hypothetical protein
MGNPCHPQKVNKSDPSPDCSNQLAGLSWSGTGGAAAIHRCINKEFSANSRNWCKLFKSI